jgi:hypothetical protein
MGLAGECTQRPDALRASVTSPVAFNEIDQGIQAVNAHFNRLCTPINVAATQPLQELYCIRTAGPLAGSGGRPPERGHTAP